MGDAYKKVQAGQKLEVPATAFNSFLDAANDFKARKHRFGADALEQFRQGDIIRVKNDTDNDRDRFDVLGLDEPIISPDDQLREFKNQVALKGVQPKRPDHVGQFAILLEPLGAGKIGRAYVSGVCPAWVDVADECHKFADIKDDEPTMLASCPVGSARILWREGETGPQWAVVRLGNFGEDIRRFKLMEPLDRCGSADAERITFKDDKWCETDCEFEVHDSLGVVCSDLSHGSSSSGGGDSNPGESSSSGSCCCSSGDSVPAGTVGWARWMPDSEKWEVLQLGEGCCDSSSSSSSSSSSGPTGITISEADVRCESGQLKVYRRTITLRISCCNLTKEEGDWYFDHVAGCCACSSSSSSSSGSSSSGCSSSGSGSSSG